MAQFRTVADIQDSVLQRAGEVTNGNSAFETRSLEIINRIHRNIIVGGHELNNEIDEIWAWAQRDPLILELQPAYETGSVSLTQGSEAGTFSSAPSDSKAGWHIRVGSRPGVYKIISHTAGASAFELDGAYAEDTGAALSFKVFKIDYELTSSYIYIDSGSNKLDFEEVASTEITATLTVGGYTPAELATEIQTQLNAAGTATYTATYDPITRKFTLASDLAGPVLFKLLCQSGTNQKKSAWARIGFDDEDVASAASHEAIYEQSSVARLMEPIIMHQRTYGRQDIPSVEKNRFQKDFPIQDVREELPCAFTILNESYEGRMSIRFNSYPDEKVRIEVPYIPIPRDLKDNSASIPHIPRKDIEVLEFGACAEILEEKADNRADRYFTRASSKLMAMVRRNRRDEQRRGRYFAQVISRLDQVRGQRRKLIYGVPEES